MRILVAEDEIDLAGGTENDARMQNSVEVVHDGADALFYAEQHRTTLPGCQRCRRNLEEVVRITCRGIPSF